MTVPAPGTVAVGEGVAHPPERAPPRIVGSRRPARKDAALQ